MPALRPNRGRRIAQGAYRRDRQARVAGLPQGVPALRSHPIAPPKPPDTVGDKSAKPPQRLIREYRGLLRCDIDFSGRIGQENEGKADSRQRDPGSLRDWQSPYQIDDRLDKDERADDNMEQSERLGEHNSPGLDE